MSVSWCRVMTTREGKINVIEFEKTFVSLARVRKVKAPRRSLTLFFRCLQTHTQEKFGRSVTFTGRCRARYKTAQGRKVQFDVFPAANKYECTRGHVIFLGAQLICFYRVFVNTVRLFWTLSRAHVSEKI
jgi:hypothetical protein